IPGSVVDPTTRRDNTGRFFAFEELSAPFTLGAFRIVPYAKGMAADYTSDLGTGPNLDPNTNPGGGSNLGRFWGGGGLRANLPFWRLYPDVQGELFKVCGLYHKIVLTGDYFYGRASTPFTRVPQLDRLNDDTSTQALREIKPQEPNLNGMAGVALATDPLF